MTALATERLTPRQGSGPFPEKVALSVKASTKIYAGAIVVMSSSGVALGATTATGHLAIGRAEATVDNTTGADGALTVVAHQGVFKYNNSASADLITLAHIGTDCFLVDDNTVAHTSNSSARSRAGKVYGVDSDGVWVQLSIGV